MKFILDPFRHFPSYHVVFIGVCNNVVGVNRKAKTQNLKSSVVVVSRHMPGIGLSWGHRALVASETGDALEDAWPYTNHR